MPLVFNRDLALMQHLIRLHSRKDLAEITQPAQNRKCWKVVLASQIEKAVEESQTKNCVTNGNKSVGHLTCSMNINYLSHTVLFQVSIL